MCVYVSVSSVCLCVFLCEYIKGKIFNCVRHVRASISSVVYKHLTIPIQFANEEKKHNNNKAKQSTAKQIYWKG